MTFEERYYKTLVVSSSQKFNETISPLLLSSHCDKPVFVDSIAQAKQKFLENHFDYVIINTPLKDDIGTKFAIDVSTGKNTVCLLFVRAEIYSEIKSKVTPHGVFTLAKPISITAITHAIDFLAAARERLRKLEKKALTIEEKMEEIRLINRAKWVLLDRLKMSEPDAHRYIEKQAMDRCVTKGEVAKEIIKTYS